MISDIQLLFGLANRTRRYGLGKKIADPKIIKLNEIFNHSIDGVDGAENYGWRKDDLIEISKNQNKLFFTKIEVLPNKKLTIEQLIKKYHLKSKFPYLHGIYMHDLVINESLELYKKFFYFIKEKYNVKIGISIYSQKDIDLIEEKNIKLDILQVPMNINCDINASALIEKKCEVFARSIFLQGAYFLKSNLYFNDTICKKLESQKNYLMKLATLNGMDLGQFLFSEAIHLSKKNFYKGIIFNTSKIERLITYIHNHADINPEFYDDKLKYELRNEYLADPRKWKL